MLLDYAVVCCDVLLDAPGNTNTQDGFCGVSHQHGYGDAVGLNVVGVMGIHLGWLIGAHNDTHTHHRGG